MAKWTCALELDRSYKQTSGSEKSLCDAIRRGADLRISAATIHNEHIDPSSDNDDVIREMLATPVTYLIDDCFTAGIMTDRVPLTPPNGFGARMSMSFFIFNQDAVQAIARPYLDGPPADGTLGPAPVSQNPVMPKYHQFESWDEGTNAPSQNFIYDFEYYRFMVDEQWQEMFAHEADGTVTQGSHDALVDAVYGEGCEVKVSIRNLCSELAEDFDEAIDHEVFVSLNSTYHYNKGKMLLGPSRTVVRVSPSTPLAYRSKGWDFGYIMPRTDGFVASWLCDPYTLKFYKKEGRYAIRWFVRK